MNTSRTVLAGATVVDVRDGTRYREVDIAVDGARIAAITPAEPLHPEQVTVIDARGTFAVPGFCDMHAHPLNRTDPEPSLRLMLACGVTAFRQMSGSRRLLRARARGELRLPADGAALLATPGDVLLPFNAGTKDVALQSVRSQAEAGADFIKVVLLTPPVFYAAQAEAARLGLTTVGHLPVGIDVRAASDGRMRSIEHLGPGVGMIAACCDHEADIQQAMRSRSVTKMPKPPKIPFAKQLMEMMVDRKMSQIVVNPLLLDKPADVQLIADAGQAFSDEKTVALARTFARDGTWQCPTLIRSRTQQFCDDPAYRDNPHNRFASRRTLRRWTKATDKYRSRPAAMRSTYRDHYHRQLCMTRIFDEEGVKMLAGSDAGGSAWEIPGFALHEEFDQLAAAGLTPLRILQMATLNPAEFLGRTESMGTVEPGKNADLVLLSGNPVENAANLHAVVGVMRTGRYYSTRDLTGIIESVAEERSGV